ncbi:MAG: LytTR family transcriptional regulator [Bacteroidetes bacterium]|uniref:LytTR family transcriptional regulator n=1 Tax=Candidatus Cryptobacteroides gallistercoris TaxID=2840765 RepID=A0A940DNY5_9BACT|nr:LytTR family transcriptional regulator [Candidatus Cryptobacteroides gallistercoris]
MQKRRMLPKYLLERHQLTGTVTFAVLFSIIYLNLYVPFSDTAWFRLGNSVLFLFTAGFIAISILFLAASRVVMYKTRKMFGMTVLQYVLWCVAEVVVICLFYTFVTADIVRPEGVSATVAFFKALISASVALLVPYMMSAMYFIISEKEKTIRMMSVSAGVRNDMPMSFYDNGGSLKLAVKSSDLYYIESDDNYVKVWYGDAGGRLRMYQLRSSMKNIEEAFKDTKLVRCNRKYVVNMQKVKSLRKDPEGYFLCLDCSEIPPVPVTRTYSGKVLSCFSGAGGGA